MLLYLMFFFGFMIYLGAISMNIKIWSQMFSFLFGFALFFVDHDLREVQKTIFSWLKLVVLLAIIAIAAIWFLALTDPQRVSNH